MHPQQRYFSALLFAILAIQCGCRSSLYNADGVKQFQAGQYQNALNNFQQAVAANPNNSDAYYNLAATLHDWGRQSRNEDLLEQSESLYHRCLDISPDHIDCYRALSVLLVDTNRKESAFTLLERWAERSPTLPEPQIELARLYEEFGDNQTARQYLTRALDVNSSSSRAWAALGRLREDEGRLAQALTNYQQAYNLNRYHPGIPQRIAALQQRIATRPGTTPSLGASGANGTRITRSTSPTDWVPR